jgi:succinate dehydrogenase/fumarate reductase-like Fe-S protein
MRQVIINSSVTWSFRFSCNAMGCGACMLVDVGEKRRPFPISDVT